MNNEQLTVDNEIKGYIGEQYKYPNDETLFTLERVSCCSFHFVGGHWCTDSVFENLIRIKTGKQVYQEVQHELFEV